MRRGDRDTPRLRAHTTGEACLPTDVNRTDNKRGCFVRTMTSLARVNAAHVTDPTRVGCHTLRVSGS